MDTSEPFEQHSQSGQDGLFAQFENIPLFLKEISRAYHETQSFEQVDWTGFPNDEQVFRDAFESIKSILLSFYLTLQNFVLKTLRLLKILTKNLLAVMHVNLSLLLMLKLFLLASTQNHP